MVNSGVLFFLRFSQQAVAFVTHAAQSNPQLRAYKRRVRSLLNDVSDRITELLQAAEGMSALPEWMRGALHMLQVTPPPTVTVTSATALNPTPTPLTLPL